MNPKQAFEATQMIDQFLDGAGLRDYVCEEAAITEKLIRGSRLLAPCLLLGETALVAVDKLREPDSDAKWSHTMSYRNPELPRAIALASITFFYEKPPQISLGEYPVDDPAEKILQDIRTLKIA